MESIIQSSVANSITYENYRNTIDTLLKEGKSTGHEQSEALTHYSELNVTRMNRLDKTMTVAAEFAEQLKELKDKNYDIYINLCEGYLEWKVPSIDVITSLDLLALPYTGPSANLYDPTKAIMKYLKILNKI